MVVSSNDTTENSTSQVPTTTSFALQSGDHYDNTTTSLLTSQGFTEIPETSRPTMPSTTEAYLRPNTTPPNVTTHSTTGCPNGDTNDCRSISPSQCYKSDKYDGCCGTCEAYRGNNPDCPFGDRVEKCYPDQPGRCYRDRHLFDCCNTCETALVDVPGCQYGDKKTGCQEENCDNKYSSKQLDDCCGTCSYVVTTTSLITTTTLPSSPPPTTTTPTLPTTSTTRLTTTSTKTKPPSSSSTPGISSGNPGSLAYIVPVSASVGGVLLILLVIFVILWWRRRKQSSDRLSPMNEKKYNDYQLSQRAPMALPRDLDQIIKPSLTRSDSAEYAYINPDDVIIDDESNRTWNDPSLEKQTGPVEYLELGEADKYGYLEALGLVIEKRETRPSIDMDTCKQTSQEKEDSCVEYLNEHTSPQRSNTYEKFPTDGVLSTQN